MIRVLIAFSVVGTAAVTASLLKHDEAMAPPMSVTQQQAIPVHPDRENGLALLKRAIKLSADSQYAAAMATYDSAAVDLPQIADWISLFAAGSAAFTGDTLQVARRLEAVGDTVARAWGWRTRVRAFTVAGARQRALEIATAAAETGTTQKRAEAWFRVAELQRDLGNADAQKTALLKVMQVAPENDIARDAALALSNRSDLSSSERVRVGRALLAARDLARATTLLDPILKAGLLPIAERAQIRYEIGRALFNAGKYADAVVQLKRVVRTHARGPEARFLIARAEYRQDKEDQAKRTFSSVVADYPQSGAATRALYQLADLAQDSGDFAEAAMLFERATAAPAKVEHTALALMRRGGIAFVQGDYDKAAEIFEKFRKRYPDGAYHAQATYWAAQSYIRNGQKAKGNELLRDVQQASPVSYYGMRAAMATGLSPIVHSVGAGPSDDPAVVRPIESGLDRWQLLREVEWNDAAAFELRALKQRYQANHAAMYFIAEQLNERGAPHLGITTGRELLSSGTGWNQRLLKIMYPMPYRATIEHESRLNGLDPYFVTALIRQESRFNHKAVSGAGAIGLMQVMPATGRQLGPLLNVGPVTAATLTDAEVNIKLGTRFLADLYGIYGNRVDAVLIAYNAGPSRASRWRKLPEFGTEDLFIERIPFDETREYVKVVTLNAAVYRALYASQKVGD